jgi:ParB-like chromosome segregation protein Spo0J
MRTHPMAVEEVPLDAIQQHPDNANNGDLDALEESIEINGFYSPLIVQRSTGFILAGNHRYIVALGRRARTIPVIYLDVDDLEAKRIMLADNAITRRGFDDEPSLLNALHELYATDLGLHGSGYDTDMMAKLDSSINERLDFDTDPATPREEKTDPVARPMRFSVTPVLAEYGEILLVEVTKEGMGAMSKSDVNAVRKALGLKPYTIDDFAAMEVPR